MTGSAPGRQYPKATWTSAGRVSPIPHSQLPSKAYLHGHLPVIDRDLPCEEIGTDRSLVTCAELLVDL